MSIYKNIKRIATKKNIQQKDIAAAFDVTENTMTNYLTGRTKIIADQVPLFAKILKVSIEELYNDSYSEKKDLKKSEDPEIKYFNCPECIEKQKRLDKAEKERDDFRQKYIECLEELAGKKKAAS